MNCDFFSCEKHYPMQGIRNEENQSLRLIRSYIYQKTYKVLSSERSGIPATKVMLIYGCNID